MPYVAKPKPCYMDQFEFYKVIDGRKVYRGNGRLYSWDELHGEIIPLFRMFGKMGLLNTTVGCILPTVSTAFMIFMFRQAAKSFPDEIIEAARIDGVGEWGIYFKMFLPIMKSTYAAAAIVSFMNAWNSYMWPLIVLQNENSKTMPILVSGLTARYTIDYGSMMLAVTISTIPMLIIFFVLQKNFVEGITGSVKS